MPVTRTARRAWTWGGGVAAAALLAWGGVNAVSYVAHEEEVVITDVSRRGVALVDVRGRGDVTVDGGLTSGPITVTAQLTHGLRGPDHGVRVEGGRLVVWAECPEVLGGRCSASLSLTVPAGVDVIAHADHGTVGVTGLRGSVLATSDHGDVVGDDLSGDVALQSDHGDVLAGGLSGRRVRADSDHGDIALALTRPARVVDAASDHGDVEVVVPAGPAYRVDTRADHGTARADVRVDPTSPRAVLVRTAHGDAVVRYPSAPAVSAGSTRRSISRSTSSVVTTRA